jgi:hypothetical protein
MICLPLTIILDHVGAYQTQTIHKQLSVASVNGTGMLQEEKRLLQRMEKRRSL